MSVPSFHHATPSVPHRDGGPDDAAPLNSHAGEFGDDQHHPLAYDGAYGARSADVSDSRATAGTSARDRTSRHSNDHRVPDSRERDRNERAFILEQERIERRARRSERTSLHSPGQRSVGRSLQRSRRAGSRKFAMDSFHKRASNVDRRVRRRHRSEQPFADRDPGEWTMHREYHRDHVNNDDVAFGARHMSSRTLIVFKGVALGAVLVLLPLALWRVWYQSGASTHSTATRSVVALAALWWLYVVGRVAAQCWSIRQSSGTVIATTGTIWIATMIVSALSWAWPAGASAHARPHAPSTTSPAVTYVVQPGDTLWGIADMTYGDGGQWRRILEANQSVGEGTATITDPSLLRPGWRLRLPAEPAEVAPLATSTSPLRADHPVETGRVASDNEPRQPSLHSRPSPHDGEERRPASPGLWWLSGSGAVPLVLAAKRHRDYLSQSRDEVSDDEVDGVIALLRHHDPEYLRAIEEALRGRRCGLTVLTPDMVAPPPENHATLDPVVVVPIGYHGDKVLIAFARPGAELPLGPSATPLVSSRALTLRSTGRYVVSTTPDDALRALALRATFEDVVIYGGPRSDLDDDVAQRCVTLGRDALGAEPFVHVERTTFTKFDAPPVSHFVAAPSVASASNPSHSTSSVRVELLRPEPVVHGLTSPFEAGLRRRCVELVAYLAVHQNERVTGERLRARVLGTDGDDASSRTLSNTASATRRALGDDEYGPRLRPVSSVGLYELTDVDCDLLAFHRWISTARECGPDERAHEVAALRHALSLVHGEPLAAALRGFEWFLAEGHLARLQRDGEWAALRLSQLAQEDGDADTAFWAVERGRLLDPYSDLLTAALHRIPRLREFGGDGTRGAEHDAVRTG